VDGCPCNGPETTQPVPQCRWSTSAASLRQLTTVPSPLPACTRRWRPYSTFHTCSGATTRTLPLPPTVPHRPHTSLAVPATSRRPSTRRLASGITVRSRSVGWRALGCFGTTAPGGTVASRQRRSWHKNPCRRHPADNAPLSPRPPGLDDASKGVSL
jgi:hypothetical protein